MAESVWQPVAVPARPQESGLETEQWSRACIAALLHRRFLMELNHDAYLRMIDDT